VIAIFYATDNAEKFLADERESSNECEGRATILTFRPFRGHTGFDAWNFPTGGSFSLRGALIDGGQYRPSNVPLTLSMTAHKSDASFRKCVTGELFRDRVGAGGAERDNSSPIHECPLL